MTVVEEVRAQDWERDWWGDCTRTFGEEAKQLTYAHRMGLVNQPSGGHWPVYDLEGKSVLDLGGGPVSMLLKTVNRGNFLAVVDPCDYPNWVSTRYEEAGIFYYREPAEDFNAFGDGAVPLKAWDECWIYNVLQHVVDPQAVIAAARRSAKVLRIFEWVETYTNVGHPHSLHANELNDWIGATGTVGMVNENGAVGLAYWGAFGLGVGAPNDPQGHTGVAGATGGP